MLTFVPHFFCDVLLTKVSEKKHFGKNMIEMISKLLYFKLKQFDTINLWDVSIEVQYRYIDIQLPT
jgi:beta-galactosidase beta subunit